VKGPQDRACPFADIPIIAQLNVTADTLAGTYQDMYGEARTKVHLFPHTGVQMNTSQGTIISKLQRAIADQQDAAIRNTINWTVHGKVFQLHIS
jgi:hypothetical protein